MSKRKASATKKLAPKNRGKSGAKKAKVSIQGSLVVLGTKKSSSGGVGLVKLGLLDNVQDKAKADVASNLGATQSLRDLLKSTGWS
jgi:hypothetical protein